MSLAFAGRCRRTIVALSVLAAMTITGGSVLAGSDALLVELIAAGQIEEARALFAERDPTPTDWLFFDGRVAKSDGRFIVAIATFREVLRQDPTYIAARRELAHSLLLAEDYRASAVHFNELLKSDPAVDQHEGYLHFLNEIDRRRPFSLSGHFAIISSSNVNRGSSKDRFNPDGPDGPSFDITSQAEPGTGIELGLSGDHLWRAQDGDRWALNWGLSGRKFQGGSEDSVTASIGLKYGRLTDRARWNLGPFTRRTWAATDEGNAVLGLSADLDRRLSLRTSAFAGGTAEYQDHLSGDETDGPRYNAQVGVVRGFRSGTLTMGTSAELSRPEAEHHAFDGVAVFVRGARSWNGGFNGELGLDVGRRDYLDTFPLTKEAREDRFYEITATVQHDAIRIGRFSPRVRCTVGETHSNIAFYDYDFMECDVEVLMRF